MARTVSRPRRSLTPALDRLTTDERGRLLDGMLAAHPELIDETERRALDRLAAVDAGEVAESIEGALRAADADQLAHRAGRVHGRGYVHEARGGAAGEAGFKIFGQESRSPDSLSKGSPVTAESVLSTTLDMIAITLASS